MGGKFFAVGDKNPCIRIPTEYLQPMAESVLETFSSFFDKMEMVTSPDQFDKKDHGDIDFVCLVSDDQREKLRKFLGSTGYMFGHNGPMEHIAFPFKGGFEGRNIKTYQIDLIFAGDPKTYETIRYFYSRPITMNSVVGQFARSLGYLFSTEGFFLLVKDAKKQNRKILLTRDLEVSYNIMQLPEFDDKEIFKSPEAFSQWIQSSPRFDSERFQGSHNRKSHRDSYSDSFCSQVYKILDECGQKSDIKVHDVDFSENPEIDLNEAMSYEIGILGPEIVQKMMEQLAKFKQFKKPIISGDTILRLGYPQGKLVGSIIQAVSERFKEEDSEEDMIFFVKETFPLDNE